MSPRTGRCRTCCPLVWPVEEDRQLPSDSRAHRARSSDPPARSAGRPDGRARRNAPARRCWPFGSSPISIRLTGKLRACAGSAAARLRPPGCRRAPGPEPSPAARWSVRWHRSARSSRARSCVSMSVARCHGSVDDVYSAVCSFDFSCFISSMKVPPSVRWTARAPRNRADRAHHEPGRRPRCVGQQDPQELACGGPGRQPGRSGYRPSRRAWAPGSPSRRRPPTRCRPRPCRSSTAPGTGSRRGCPRQS